MEVIALYKGLIQSPLLLPAAVPGQRRQDVEKEVGVVEEDEKVSKGRQRKATLT